MEENKSIAVKAVHGRGDALEQDYGKSWEQHGDQMPGRIPPGEKPIQPSSQSPNNGEIKLPLTGREKQVKLCRRGENNPNTRNKINDNSHKARCDYARHESGAGVMEAASDVQHDYLQTMTLDYYRTNINISDQKAREQQMTLQAIFGLQKGESVSQPPTQEQ